MTSYRPPLGGLFRLSGPSGQSSAARPDRAEEARDAIRHFVRVLERLDRDVGTLARPRPRTGRSKSR